MQYQETDTLARAFTSLHKIACEKQYNATSKKLSTQKSVPVAQQVKNTLEREKQMIQNMIEKKRNQQEKWNRISSANLEYRDKLRKKIVEDQSAHEKKRGQFLEKRVKAERFKSSQVNRKRDQLEEKRLQAKKQNEQQFRSHKSKTIEFWNIQDVKTQEKYAVQTAAPPLYQDAIHRKLGFEHQNIKFSEKTRQQLLRRHSKCFGNKKNMFVTTQRPFWQDHNIQCEQNFEKNLEILDKKKKQFINNIGNAHDKSQNLLKQQKQAFMKKLKGRIIDEHDLFEKNKSQLKEFQLTRAKSMKQCRCHDRGRVPKLQNEEEFLEEQMTSTSPFKKTGLPLFTRNNFARRAQIHRNIVSDNQTRIKQAQDLKNERKLNLEREISEAIQKKKNILNQSNCIARTTRVNA